MNRINGGDQFNVDKQSGTTLIVAMMLILLASLLALFAMNVGIFSQRTSAADLRARVIHQTLEAALSQGIEYIKANSSIVDQTKTSLWKLCDSTDTTFPCGSVPQCAPSGTDSNSDSSDGQNTCTGGMMRRANMYYYKGGGTYDVNNDGDKTDQLDLRSLPIGTSLMTTASNGFNVSYGVGALMCVVKQPNAVTDPTECTTTSSNASGTYLFTMTAVGSLPEESASTTLSTTFGTIPIAPGGANAPTITASGTLDLTGNGTFVTNNNAGGPGVPVTVWSPQCVTEQGAGTANSCYLEDWLRTANGVNGNSTYSFAANSDGTASTVPVCSGNGNKACSCSTSLSSASGNLVLGVDVLTNQAVGGCNEKGSGQVVGTSGCTDPTTCQANYNVVEDEFPCDLFNYIFHVSAWDDLVVQSPGTSNPNCIEASTVGGTVPSGGGDCFCEYHRAKTVLVADGSSQSMGYDEAWLYSNAKYIYPSTAHTAWVLAAKKATSCTDLISKANANGTGGGIIWDQSGTCLKSATQIGYPNQPVVLVSDATATLQGATMFGLLFVRDTTAAGSSTAKYGGAATFNANSNGTLYGSVVVQGTATKLNGTTAIIYNSTVMKNLNPPGGGKNPSAPLPGSWTDRYSY